MNIPSASGLASSDLVQRLFKHADSNNDGQVSADEFKAFLAGALHQNTVSSADKDAFMQLAQHIPATTANLQQIATALGPKVGHIEADGVTYALADSSGQIGIRNTGRGPEWQWIKGQSHE